MNGNKAPLPIYGLPAFSVPERKGQLFQVEVFDANRHFQVEYPHRHDFFEVLFLSQGSGFHVIDSNRYEIKPPCIFFMSKGQAHKLELSSDINGYIFIFAPEFYLYDQSNQNRLLEFPFFFTIQQTNPPLLLQHDEDVKFIETLFVRAIEEVAKTPFSTSVLRSILDLILVSCESMYEKENQIAERGKGHLLVKQFYQLVENQYHQNLTVAQYADMLSVTSAHLTQTVKEITGKTSSAIICSKQILEMKRLLVHTNMSVTEISAYMGFADQSYFTKFFKRETGQTPLAFRTEAAI